ncbi:hypothetical protein [Nannocystis sp. SCPEA4]|uniref:hypothetical protein n=1 Tax=Nannocystis sp. SCPEA4 TaxID=2996787 RepID=UPI002271C858|nr:hypothetical protein [Nannocystis sp. SCPEA4]MCY1055289.1 hypothetical protein [Nannocystis sp. SCPEA4]
MIHRRHIGVLAALVVAVSASCGDDTAQQGTDTAGTSTTADTTGAEPPQLPSWLFGSWSAEFVGFDFNVCAMEHLQFHADGRALQGAVTCETMVPVFDKEFTWEAAGDDMVIVQLPDSEYEEAWQVRMGTDPRTSEKDCDVLEVVLVVAGVPGDKRHYVRGEVCFETVPAEEGVGNWDPYRSVWCDGPPLACESSP